MLDEIHKPSPRRPCPGGPWGRWSTAHRSYPSGCRAAGGVSLCPRPPAAATAEGARGTETLPLSPIFSGLIVNYCPPVPATGLAPPPVSRVAPCLGSWGFGARTACTGWLRGPAAEADALDPLTECPSTCAGQTAARGNKRQAGREMPAIMQEPIPLKVGWLLGFDALPSTQLVSSRTVRIWLSLLMPCYCSPQGGAWSEEEDAILATMQKEVGNHWSTIAQHIPGRTGQQCAQRWRHKVNPNIRKDKWTEEEDNLLATLVEKFGCRWAEIARRCNGRTDQQCMGRWRRHLDPAISRVS